ncbi:MAG: glycosyltransferase family 4 protein [Acidimicrobiaceae bacterium]|nr:glycosyltransferase family 4 protein [Acidimicrobiaceae bacterium]
MSGTLAFVSPRFGPGVVGGSEAVSREIALGLAGRGWDIEVLTTCAVDHYTWENELAPGVSEEEGVTVRRFETVESRTRVGHRTHISIYYGRPTSLDEQVGWLSFPFRVPKLFQHLLRHGHGYDAVFFSPYLFWTTTVCMPLVADRAVVIPCLHDEVYARLEAIRPVLADPARAWFLSEPEHQLAHRLGPVTEHHSVTGAGVDIPSSYDPAGFRQRHGIRRPFILFAGRREVDKGWNWLLDAYAESLDLDDSGFDLVSVGVGEPVVPRALLGRVHDLGFLSTAERDNAFAAAAAYVQPSLMESFSRSVMESWLAATPVLVREGSEVVAWHCERSGGGEIFADGVGLARRLRHLSDHPAMAAEMAQRGRRYVLDTYTWPVVLDRMEADLKSMLH